MNQTAFSELVESSQEFTPEDWIAFDKLTHSIENETNPALFIEEMLASIQHTDEIFIENQKNKIKKQELKTFAKGNKEAVEALLKAYEEKLEPVDVSEIFTNAAFYKHADKPESTLSCDAKPWTPSLNAEAPAWTPNAEAKAFEFSTDAPEWTPSASSSSLSIEAPEFKPSFSIDAPEFIPQSSSKPLCMPSALGITESIANGCHSAYDSFFDDSPGRPVSFSKLVAPPPVEAKPKVYVCEVDKQTYSVDWLLQVRLEKKFINPAPEIPADVAHPLYRRTEIWTEKQFNPYKYEVNEDEDVLDDLGKFVTPVFQDEIDYDEVCDPITGMYGVDALKRLQPCYRDIHPALIDKPEILNKDTINNIIMQFMAVGGMNPLFQASLNGVPAGFPPILSPNMEMPAHCLQMLPPAMQQNFMAIFSMIQCGRSGTSSWLDDPEPSPPVEESSPESEESSVEESSKKEKAPEKPPSPASPKKKKGSKSPRSKSKKSNKVNASRFSKEALTKTPEKKAQPKLHKAKNAWTRRGVVDEEEDLAARTMQSILNKLVPEKFERLLKQALDSKQLVVTKKTTLISLTERLHKKAISEADYAPLYTHFVHKLKLAEFKSFAENGEETDIETVLLELCLTRLNAEVEFEEGDDEAEKEMKTNKFWKQTLGNYTLLAEMYKRGVLEHEKLSAIVRTLVGIVMNTEEEHDNRAKRVEQLYHLLKACGTEFEEECKERNHFRGDEPHVLEKHFLELTKATTDDSLKRRVRFMLQDLVELKNKHWESRDRGGMDPKFLSEIREEIRKEQVVKKQFLCKLRRRQAPAKKESWSKRKSQTPRGTRSSKRRGTHTPRDSPRQRRCLKSLSDSDVLSAAAGRKKKDSPIPIEKSKRSPKIDKIAWAKLVQGALEENQQPEAKSVPVQKTPPVINAWAKGPPSNLSIKDDTYETKTNISSDPSDTLSQSTNSSANESELDDLIIEQKLLEFFETENGGSSLFEDILENGVLPERFILTVLNVTIEKTDKHRTKLGQLFVQLRKDKVISSEEFLKGFEKASEYFEDWCLDVPRLPEFVQEWLALMQKEDLQTAQDFGFLPSRFVNSPLETYV